MLTAHLPADLPQHDDPWPARMLNHSTHCRVGTSNWPHLMMVKDAISMNRSIVLPVMFGHNRTWRIRDWPHLLMLKDAIAINDSSVIPCNPWAQHDMEIRDRPHLEVEEDAIAIDDSIVLHVVLADE